MRYPLWTFFFVFIMPPFAAHALLTGQASIMTTSQRVDMASVTTVQGTGYWRHEVSAR